MCVCVNIRAAHVFECVCVFELRIERECIERENKSKSLASPLTYIR